MPFSPIAAINAASSLFWLALALAVAYALYWLYEHVYKPFMDTDSASFKANERNITNFFTPHSDDGSVAPKTLRQLEQTLWIGCLCNMTTRLRRAQDAGQRGQEP